MDCLITSTRDTMLSLSLLLLFSSTWALNFNPIYLIDPSPVDSSNTSTTCPSHLCIRDTSSTNIYPWLINNVQAKFIYVRTDSIDYAVYRFLRQYNGQTLTYWLHMYDEGIFYNGFWVVNDLEDGYEEVEGRVFIYNSEKDKCPQDTKNYWYIWKGGDWVYNTNIYLEEC